VVSFVVFTVEGGRVVVFPSYRRFGRATWAFGEVALSPLANPATS